MTPSPLNPRTIRTSPSFGKNRRREAPSFQSGRLLHGRRPTGLYVVADGMPAAHATGEVASSEAASTPSTGWSKLRRHQRRRPSYERRARLPDPRELDPGRDVRHRSASPSSIATRPGWARPISAALVVADEIVIGQVGEQPHLSNPRRRHDAGHRGPPLIAWQIKPQACLFPCSRKREDYCRTATSSPALSATGSTSRSDTRVVSIATGAIATSSAPTTSTATSSSMEIADIVGNSAATTPSRASSSSRAHLAAAATTSPQCSVEDRLGNSVPS